MVTGSRTFGSTVAGGAGNLVLAICWVDSGGYHMAGGGGMTTMRLGQNERTIYTLSAIIDGLAADTYQVGMCGYSTDAANWNWNGYGSTTVLVYTASGVVNAPQQEGDR